ncbi:MAG: DUF5666 domain-containing protein [Acidobacteriia bacterium]|nr:DUF5666 domain-containing protein [Terriglobia bacterium]
MVVSCLERGSDFARQVRLRCAGLRVVVALTTVGLAVFTLTGRAQDAPSSVPNVVRPVGTVKAITNNAVTLATDAGATLNVLIQDSTRMVRTAPGQKDLQGATPLGLAELQVGDRMLVRGKPSDDGKSVLALSVIVIKRTDIAAKQEREREDWQKRGIGGLVKVVDPGNGSVTVTVSAFGASKTVDVHYSKDTMIRRYAPDSVRFDDAKAGTVDQIKPGDQLRARGNRSADGAELSAEEIVSGAFRNIAGTVISTDPTNHLITVNDLATKKPATLKVNDDSQLRSLPPMVARRIALRLRGGTPQPGENGSAHPGAPAAEQPAETRPAGGGGGRQGGAPDFQQMLGRMPAVTLGDLQKGSAVMIVATEGTAASPSTAITLLTGVEPVLTASPDSGQAAMLLSPWNLSGAGGEAALGTNP